MNRTRLLLATLAAALILLSWGGVLSVRAGLVQESLDIGGIPAIFLAPADGENLPAVLVGHGFAGSKQLMLGYGYTLAQAGYAVLLWDFASHGANALPISAHPVQSDVDAVYAALIARPEVDPTRVGIMGHSRGSGAAMSAAIRNPERYAAVVAISPTGADVTPTLPRNILFQAGTWEPGFLANAERLLAAAGGPNPDLAAGLGRAIYEIPNAEHISILFRPLSHHLTVAWFDSTFDHVSRAMITDRRIGWYGLHLLAWMVMLAAISPLWRERSPSITVGSRWRPWLGIVLAPVLALGALMLLNRVVAVGSLGGMLVGSAVAVWFLVAGLAWLAVIGGFGRLRGEQIGRDLLLGVGLFVLLSLAFGVMAQSVWVHWWPNMVRLTRWPLLVLGVFPWFLAVALTQQSLNAWMRPLWWLVKSVIVLVGLIALQINVPGLTILGLMAPIIPILFIILDFANVHVRRPWAYALGSALFLGWVLATVFPLSG
jgi:dienelactone hydrolase